MRRLSASLLMLVLLPGLAEAQANSRSYTVVRGETLWELAARFCGDPFRWPEIFQANRNQIANPDQISPDQVLTISCAPAEVRAVEIVVLEPEPEPEPEPPFNERAVRTVFHPTPPGSVLELDRPDVLALSRDASWSASWLLLGTDAPWTAGRIVDLLSGELSRTAMLYQRVRVESEAQPALGDVFQIFRTERVIEGLGTVLSPTGMISVTSVGDHGFEGVVLKSYDRVVEGDLVVPAPEFDLEPGDAARAVSSDATARILAFGLMHEIQQIGDIALLDRGSSDGVSLGDEYVLVMGVKEGWAGQVAGRLQIVRVTEETSSARLVQIQQPSFRTGLQVRLDRKMR